MGNYVDNILKQILKSKKEANFSKIISKELIPDEELLDKPKILKSDKLMNDFEEHARAVYVKKMLRGIHDYKLRK